MINVELDDHLVVMHQRRHDRVGIELEIFWPVLIAALQPQHLSLPRQRFFCERQPDLDGADGCCAVVEVKHEVGLPFEDHTTEPRAFSLIRG